MKLYCFKSLLFVMLMTMSVPSCAQKLIDATPDKNNQKVIKKYNRYHHPQRQSSGQPLGYTAVFGVMKNSTMSTVDVEVNVVKRWVQDAAINDMENRFYFIEIKNKTDNTIYIDKGNCYRVNNDSTRYCYFDSKRNDSCSNKRIIAIPPHSKKNLSDYHAVLTKNGKYQELKIIDYPEDFDWDAKSAGVYEGFLQEYEVRTFTEDNSPYYRSFLITYSKDAGFSTYSRMTINCYMRQLIGAYYPELYKENNIFDRLGGDEYTITNCEYGYGGVNRLRDGYMNR